MSKGETYLIRRTAGEQPGELIRVPDELVVLASASQRRAAEDVAIQANGRDLLFVLFRHLRKSIIFFAAVFGMALLAAMVLPSSYKSTASLLVRLGPESMLPDPSVQIGKAVVAPIQSRTAEINTELQILRSREVAEAVIGELGTARILGGAPAEKMAKVDDNDDAVKAAIMLIDRKLEVEVEPDSNVLKVNFESKDPRVAKDVVDTYIDKFRSVRAGIHRNPITAQFFGDQQENVRKEIEKLETEIRVLKDATGVGDLKEQRAVVTARLARLQTDIDTVRNQLGATNAMENHPAMQRLRSLESQHREAETSLKQINALDGKLAALERDFGVKSETFKQYATIAQQAGVDRAMSDGKLSNISIVQAATLPLSPSKPDRKLLLGIGLFLALSGAIGLAFVAEAIDHTVKRPEDMALMGVQRCVSIPMIGALQKAGGQTKVEPLPAAKTAAASGLVQNRAGFTAGPWSAIDPSEEEPRDIVPSPHENHHPVSWFHDLRQGVRRLAERVLTGTGMDGTNPRVIAIIGTKHGEGATTLACATAALLAERAQLDAPKGVLDEVLLIDCDLHAPTLHRQLGIDPSPGLTDWLADPSSSELPLEATIKISPVEGLAVMPAGVLRGGALTPNRLKRLIDIVAPNYRYVVIDLPPLDESPEAARLASVCDGTVVVIEAEKLRKQIVVETLQNLQEANVHILGAVLNKRTYPVPEWLYERV